MPKLGKERRVHGRDAVQGLFKEGRGGFAHPLRYLMVVGTSEPGVAAMVSAPKKLHKRAVERNLLKRRMREAFRLQSAELHQQAIEKGIGIRLALLYTTKDILDYKTISEAVEGACAHVGQVLNKLSDE